MSWQKEDVKWIPRPFFCVTWASGKPSMEYVLLEGICDLEKTIE